MRQRSARQGTLLSSGDGSGDVALACDCPSQAVGTTKYSVRANHINWSPPFLEESCRRQLVGRVVVGSQCSVTHRSAGWTSQAQVRARRHRHHGSFCVWMRPLAIVFLRARFVRIYGIAISWFHARGSIDCASLAGGAAALRRRPRCVPELLGVGSASPRHAARAAARVERHVSSSGNTISLAITPDHIFGFRHAMLLRGSPTQEALTRCVDGELSPPWMRVARRYSLVSDFGER